MHSAVMINGSYRENEDSNTGEEDITCATDLRGDEDLTQSIETEDIPWNSIPLHGMHEELGRYTLSSLTGSRPSCKGLKQTSKKKRSKVEKKRKAQKLARRKNRK